MTPQGGKKKTILFGKCIYQAHKDNPDINEIIEVGRIIFENLDLIPGKFLKRYQDRSEFDESFFSIR